MQTPEAVAAKRRVLVDALTMCLERSKVREVVSLDTIRSLLQSASGELWREGEFRLEMVWKILCQQPGLTAKEVAPPLLLFKSFEETLGVQVRIPQALSAIPRGDQVKLRDEVSITPDDFKKAVEKFHTDQSTPPERAADMGKAARAAAESTAPVRRRPKDASRLQKMVAAALSVCAAIGIATSLWLSFRDTAKETNLSDVAAILQLTDGRRAEECMTARISDPRWETLGPDERKRIVTQIFERERQNGIRSLVLIDGQKRVRASASDSTGRTVVSAH